MKYDTITVGGQRFVVVPADEFALIQAGAPPLPPADADGTRPALAFLQANIARTIVRDRAAAGLTQRELAAAAGIRPEILNRAERGVVMPSPRTLGKIEAALARAGLRREPPTPKPTPSARPARTRRRSA